MLSKKKNEENTTNIYENPRNTSKRREKTRKREKYVLREEYGIAVKSIVKNQE